MRILRVIPSLDPATGGPAAGLRAMTPVLSAMEHETEVACLDEPEAKYLQEFPAPVHGLGPARTSYRWSARLRPWLAQNAKRFDVVIVHGLWQFPGLCTWSMLCKMDVPYFVYPHGMLDPWFKRTYPLKHLKKWLYWPWAEYRVLRDAKAVLFTSEEERRLARESFWLYRCNERVVGYGTAAPPENVSEQTDAFLSKYTVLRGKRFLLFLSRIHPKKGCELLLKAYAQTDFRFPLSAFRSQPPSLVIAGPCADAAYRESLRSLAVNLNLDLVDLTNPSQATSNRATDANEKKRVYFMPMLTGDVKWGALRLAEAFILPSHQENFGIVVAEALACGKPVLISDKINIWREIETDRAGFVAPDSVEGTSDLLRHWINTPQSNREIMSGNARQCFESRFEITNAAKALVEIIESTTKNKLD
jgi:glycosyltransferase involved in cell wall biosynthesis